MIKAIIFDLDGVIVDSEPLHELAFTHVLNKYGKNLTHNDYCRYCLGKTDLECFDNFARNYNLFEVDIITLAKEKSEYYSKDLVKNISAYPGIIELLGDLEDKYKLGVASNSKKVELDSILKKLKLNKIFKCSLSADDIKKGKPDPEIYQTICKKLKVEPDTALAIEDTRSGVLSAKAAGLQCFAMLTTSSPSEIDVADKVFNNFFELKNFLNNL